jgi:hypothetical protein
MSTVTYSLSGIFPFVRESLRGKGNFSYDNFVTSLLMELEKVQAPGVVRVPPEQSYKLQMYDFSQAPYDLKFSTAEAFFYLLHNGLIIPEPPQDLPSNLHQQVRYMLTPRGLEWAAGKEPLPEDVAGYMKLLHELVPNLDAVIQQYILESLRSYERQMYFAAAVMVGAAAEKSVYLLAESMVEALKDASKQARLKNMIVERRGMSQLFSMVEATLHSSRKILPYPVSDGAATYLMSLIESIRVQRNDAVHPMNATVSAGSVRLSLAAFPHALEKLDSLRTWFLANPRTI